MGTKRSQTDPRSYIGLFEKGAGVHSEEAYLDEVKCDLLRLIRKRLYQQA